MNKTYEQVMTEEKISRDSADLWTMLTEILTALEKLSARVELLEKKNE